MIISGFQKTTLLDYPGHLAATIFFNGCSFRCPFCHNSELLSSDTAPQAMTDTEVLSVLKKRAGILEGVCVTGGEPTLQPGLPEFLSSVKDLGLLVKLDTNGYQPDVMISLCEQGLIDYIAMDIKSCPSRYPVVSGFPHLDFSRIQKSVTYLMQGRLPYEFRTTVVQELHSPKDFEEIGRWLQGCSAYYLQNYQDSEHVLCPGFHSCSKEELLHFASVVKPLIPNVNLRGID